MSYVYILDINSLLDVWLTDISPISVDFLFVLLMAYLSVQKFWLSPIC